MDEPLSLGLILGVILTLAGPWIARRPAIQMDAFFGKISVNSSAVLATIPLPLTPLLILLVALFDGKAGNDVVTALLLCSAVVALVGWPIAFFFTRSYLATARAERRQEPEKLD